jgi:nitrogen fixation protein NifU and related proteins
MALDQLYQQVILEHNRNPLNFGRLAGVTHSARGHDALCGDDILMELEVADGRIAQARFSGEACAVTKASASILTEWLKGKTPDEAARGYRQFSELLSRPQDGDYPELGDLVHLHSVSRFPARVRNALLPWKTALGALRAEAP